jgi:hypothetical protein
MMERMSVLPYEWFNKPVRVEAYSGETLHPFTVPGGISDPTLARVRNYFGQLESADITGLVLGLQGERRIFLSASAVLSVEQVQGEAREEES